MKETDKTSEIVKRKRYSLINIIMPTIVGGVFIALGAGVLIAIIYSVINARWQNVDGFIAVPIICFVLLPLAFGSLTLSIVIKQIYFMARGYKANKTGVQTTARIADYKTVSRNGRLNKRFSLILLFEQDGRNRMFKTDYIYDINELRYLRSLSKIKIKVDGNFAVVTEPFTKDIYKLDPVYGIEREFYTQDAVRKTMRICRILCIISVILLIASVILTVTLGNGAYLIAGAVFFGAVNIPFSVILAVYFIKWIRRTRK